MGIIKILLQKEALVFRNSYLRTRKQIAIAVALAILVPVWLGVTTWAFRDIVSVVLAELGMDIIAPLFHFIFIVFLVFSFGTMQDQARLRLLNLPELSLLITSPISANTLYLFRVILVTFSARGALFLLFVFILPGLIAVGIAGGAPWYYYLFVLPVAYSLLLVAASFAVVLILLLARVLSPKKIAQGAAVLGFLGFALWIGFMVWGMGEIGPLLLAWARAKELLWHITLPATDAAALLTGLIHGEVPFWPLTRLFVVTGVILGGSMLIARRVYYQAYERAQIVEISGKKQVKRPVREPLSLGRRSSVILTEWKKAVRNDMGLTAITLLGILGVYLFFAVGFVLPEPWNNLLFLAHIGVIGFLTSAAVEGLFTTPADVGQDSKARKEQFSVLKSAPFSGRDFVFSYWLAPFIGQILISGVILLVLHIFLGSSIPTILLSLVVLALLLGSAAAFESVLSMAAMEGKWWLATPAGFYVRAFLPVLYYILALGILALGMIYEIWLVEFLHHLPQGLEFTISGAIFLALTGFTLYYFLRLCARYWEEMEI
jgi:hypothetical protein